MTMTLEDLDKRMQHLEREVSRLRLLVERHATGATAAERGARLLQESLASQQALREGFAKALDQIGIKAEPVGAEKLQEMMRASGIKPEDNSFSRELIAMREE